MNPSRSNCRHREGRRPTAKAFADKPSRALWTFAFCPLPFDLSFRLLPAVLCLLGLLAGLGFGQQTAPYAAINHDAVRYNGPGRDAGHDVPSLEVRLGLLLPLTGPRQAEGEALRCAAQMAVDEENAASLPGGHRLQLVVRDESGPWGQASSQIVHMVFDDQAVALITSPEGGSSHLAEQVANKVGVPVLTLSTDSTTTEINLPWIFRLGPTDAAQAQAFARDIFKNRKARHVVLITQNDRDGRLGGDAFIKAAREMSAPEPVRIVLESPFTVTGEIQPQLADAQAVVVWTDAATAGQLVPKLREWRATAPLYLCRKAADNDTSEAGPPPCPTCDTRDGSRWIAAAPESREAWAGFSQRFRQRYGMEPGLGATQAYDAVRILAAALGHSGPNRARLRDSLAAVSAFPGASGLISFDHAGNDTAKLTLLRIQ